MFKPRVLQRAVSGSSISRRDDNVPAKRPRLDSAEPPAAVGETIVSPLVTGDHAPDAALYDEHIGKSADNSSMVRLTFCSSLSPELAGPRARETATGETAAIPTTANSNGSSYRSQRS